MLIRQTHIVKHPEHGVVKVHEASFPHSRYFWVAGLSLVEISEKEFRRWEKAIAETKRP